MTDWQQNQSERTRDEIEQDLDQLLADAVRATHAAGVTEDLNDVAQSWAERNGHDQ